MAEALIFHYREADNFLVRMNPCTKLLLLLAYSSVISISGPVTIFIIAFLPLATAIIIKLPFRQYIRESIFFIILAVIMGITSFLSVRDAVSALSSSIAFLAMILSSMLLTDTTMPDDLSRSLGAALSRIIGKSAYTLSAIIEITLSMIPLIVDCASSLSEAMKARCASFSSHPIRFLHQISISILSEILDEAETYIDALYSRGFDASKQHSHAKYSLSDRIIITICFLLIMSAIIFTMLQ